ncbi:MAG: molybdopterin-guanine dinucleotide biosynthesis protein B [Candidatus Hodarchaeota archaeon]
MILIQIIDVIGYSGSGKTNFITTAIKLLKRNLNYNIAVIKNVKHHPVDKRGKDSYKFTEAGASYSVIRNKNNETAVYMKFTDNKLEELLKWMKEGPFKINIIFTEGFRDLNNPSVLCVAKSDELKEQLTENVKMISGVISLRDLKNIYVSDLPLINIEREFSKFLEIFAIN